MLVVDWMNFFFGLNFEKINVSRFYLCTNSYQIPVHLHRFIFQHKNHFERTTGVLSIRRFGLKQLKCVNKLVVSTVDNTFYEHLNKQADKWKKKKTRTAEENKLKKQMRAFLLPYKNSHTVTIRIKIVYEWIPCGIWNAFVCCKCECV